MTSIDTNISNYNVSDLLSILDLNDYEHDDNLIDIIKEKTDKIIADCIEKKNDTLANFFRQVQLQFIPEETEDTETTILTEHSTSDAVVTNPANIVPRITVTKSLNIESRFRKDYIYTKSTDFKVDLPAKIYNAVEIKLAEIEIPTTFYQFADQYNNNYMWLKYKPNPTDPTSNKFILLYLSDGNYFYGTVISDINTFFYDNQLPIVFEYDYSGDDGVVVGTCKVTIKIDDTSEFYPADITMPELELNFKGVAPTTASEHAVWQDGHFYYNYDNIRPDSKLSWKLGFRLDFYLGNSTYTSEGVLDFTGPRYLFIVLNDFNNNSHSNYVNSSQYGLLNENIFARISLTGGIFSLQSQSDLAVVSDPRVYFGPVNLEKLHIQVLDEHNRVIDLNGMDISFTIRVKCLYDIPQVTATELEQSLSVAK